MLKLILTLSSISLTISKLIPFPDAIKINSEILYIFYNAEFLKSDLHFTLTVHLSLYTKFSLAIQKLKTKNFL